ncbi:Agamous-like MADS-box protein AGL92 [Arabidopsis thaliana]
MTKEGITKKLHELATLCDIKACAGKMSEHQYGARDLQDLSFHIDHYINQLNSRVKILTNNGESSSSVPPLLHTSVAGAGAAPLPVAGADLPMDQNQYEPIQLYIPIGLSYHIQYQHEIYDNFMGYVGEHAHIPFMNGNYYNYHQTPTVGLTTTGHMPSNNNNTPTTDV